MCGINIIYLSERITPDHKRLTCMNHALAHRGPDGDGIHLKPGIGLGHTRLSIVDIASGNQPMTSTNHQLTIVYNGELYNYKSLRNKLIQKGCIFKTDSDTEVVLNLYQTYGSECVNHMRGMFSFAIHESLSGKLFIARDRLGLKPLFYHWRDKRLVAASEIKAIFASGYVEPELCRASIKNYFTFQFSVSPNTMFESIYELAPGHHMTVIPGGEPQIIQYWDLEFPKEGDYESIEEQYWLEKFQAGMENAVNSHTIGDVPVGSYLSGGIDSCSITELLKKSYSQRVKTFSIGFDDPNHDESPIYREVAKYLGVENNELKFSSNNNNYLKLFSESLYHLEQPQRLSVDIPHYLLSKMVHNQNYKVVCTGDGADEVLAGYDCFRQDSMRTRSNGLIRPLFRKHRYLNKYTEYFSEDHMRMLLRLHGRDAQNKTISKFGFYPAWHDFWQITDGHLDDLFLPDDAINMDSNEQMENLIQQIKPNIEQRHPLNQSLYFETKTRLPGWILWKSDRLSMAHGVEARTPFMDHHLVELAAKTPPQFKLNGMNEKYVLKQMMASRLPEMPHQFKKRGFYTPIREWFFTAEQQDEVANYISPEAISEIGLFNPKTVSSMYAELLQTPTPQDMNSYYKCMRLEWILLTVLSVQILAKLFIGKEAACFNQQVTSKTSIFASTGTV